jgi:hypothetical protein
MADIIPISIAHVQSLLQQNNIGVTYAKISNSKMELVRSMLLNFVALP